MLQMLMYTTSDDVFAWMSRPGKPCRTMDLLHLEGRAGTNPTLLGPQKVCVTLQLPKCITVKQVRIADASLHHGCQLCPTLALYDCILGKKRLLILT